MKFLMRSSAAVMPSLIIGRILVLVVLFIQVPCMVSNLLQSHVNWRCEKSEIFVFIHRSQLLVVNEQRSSYYKFIDVCKYTVDGSNEWTNFTIDLNRNWKNCNVVLDKEMVYLNFVARSHKQLNLVHDKNFSVNCSIAMLQLENYANDRNQADQTKTFVLEIRNPLNKSKIMGIDELTFGESYDLVAKLSNFNEKIRIQSCYALLPSITSATSSKSVELINAQGCSIDSSLIGNFNYSVEIKSNEQEAIAYIPSMFSFSESNMFIIECSVALYSDEENCGEHTQPKTLIHRIKRDEKAKNIANNRNLSLITISTTDTTPNNPTNSIDSTEFLWGSGLDTSVEEHEDGINDSNFPTDVLFPMEHQETFEVERLQTKSEQRPRHNSTNIENSKIRTTTSRVKLMNDINLTADSRDSNVSSTISPEMKKIFVNEVKKFELSNTSSFISTTIGTNTLTVATSTEKASDDRNNKANNGLKLLNARLLVRVSKIKTETNSPLNIEKNNSTTATAATMTAITARVMPTTTVSTSMSHDDNRNDVHLGLVILPSTLTPTASAHNILTICVSPDELHILYNACMYLGALFLLCSSLNLLICCCCYIRGSRKSFQKQNNKRTSSIKVSEQFANYPGAIFQSASGTLTKRTKVKSENIDGTNQYWISNAELGGPNNGLHFKNNEKVADSYMENVVTSGRNRRISINSYASVKHRTGPNHIIDPKTINRSEYGTENATFRLSPTSLNSVSANNNSGFRRVAYDDMNNHQRDDSRQYSAMSKTFSGDDTVTLMTSVITSAQSNSSGGESIASSSMLVDDTTSTLPPSPQPDLLDGELVGNDFPAPPPHQKQFCNSSCKNEIIPLKVSVLNNARLVDTILTPSTIQSTFNRNALHRNTSQQPPLSSFSVTPKNAAYYNQLMFSEHDKSENENGNRESLKFQQNQHQQVFSIL